MSSIIKAIAFDFVGVFVRENDFSLDSVEQVLERKFGVINTDEAFFKWATEETGLSREILEQKVKHIVQNLYDIREPDIFEKLPKLKFSTATNHLSYLDEWFKTTLVSKHFDFSVNSANIGFQKPEMAFYSTLIKVIGEAQENILFLDDNLENCIVAEKSGLKTVHFQRGMVLSDTILKAL